MPEIAGIQVLDAFCGSGALGLEAVSRGAGRALFWDRDKKAVDALRAWCTRHHVGQCECRQQDALTPPLAPAPVDLVFLDPPYGQGMINPALSALVKAGYLSDRTVCVCETDGERPDMTILVEKTYGRSNLFIGIKTG